MSDLFGDERAADPLAPTHAAAPLADRMRPRTAAEYAGQAHLVEGGGFVANVLEKGLKQSLILWGPPGSGKTSLARLIASVSGLRFVPFSAVLSGIKEVKEVMAEAARELERTGKRTLLFVDEIHRFNRAQQDAFLPYLERGDILMIGATTENPSFALNSALLSRARTLVLEPIPIGALVALLRRALDDAERGLGERVRATDEMLTRIAHAADGDARRALNLLESASGLVATGGELDEHVLVTALQRKVLAYDKSGEQHYDLISALHKSVRNSDDNASLYWLVRMLEAGEDRIFVARRMIRMAVEDIGLADPFALRIALDAAETWERLGSPEGELALAQAAVYLARAKKSNALYVAYGEAKRDVEQSAAEPVPLHLRNAPTKLMKDAGFGAGYRYAHDDPGAKDELTCLPPGLAGKRYFGRKP
ncbi:MAG: replication-associated recombination protein A [Planctomycetes bacterium]|nr:replication-associated recombination protein A [Planctomycetota bacterium]